MGLFLDLQFYSIVLRACLCTNTMWFLSLLFCSRSWGQGWWIHPELLILLRLVFVILFFSHSRSTWELVYFWRIDLEFWRVLHWFCRLVWVRWPLFLFLILLIYEHRRSFHLLGLICILSLGTWSSCQRDLTLACLIRANSMKGVIFLISFSAYLSFE